MKVIQVMPAFALAGAEIMCENLVYEMQKNGIEVVVVSLFDYHSPITARLEKNGIRMIYLNKKPGFDFSIIRKLVKIFKQEKTDVIHTHLYLTVYAIPAAILAGVKKRVHTLHSLAGKENGRLGRFFNKCFFKINKVVPVALSPLVQESISKEYGIKKEKIPVVFNGIDLSKCLEKQDYTLGEKITILHIGRFMEPKNHLGLIEAFCAFYAKHPNSRLQLIGDGEKRETIEKTVVDRGLSNAVEFLGLQDNVYGYLHNADIFILPSLYEGIPMTLVEAMGTGLPIVATNVGGIPDMVKNNESAILTSFDCQEIVDALVKLSDNIELRKTLGTNALIRSKAFSSKEMASQYIKVYQGVFKW